jgi:enterochelin esterase-like enzyme
MSRPLRGAAIVALALGLAAAPASARDNTPKILRMPSAALHDPARSVRVYLPPSYDRPESRERRYPVLFLLHGWPGGDGNWPGQGRCADTLDSLSARGAIPEMIAVMPNGGGVGTLGRSMWLNSADGRARIEDLVAHDVVAWVDSNYRTIPDPPHRIVVGLSDGGTGAFNLVIRYPQVFGAAGSLSGRFLLRKEMGMNDAFIGRGEAGLRYLAENSPANQIEQAAPRLEGARLYIDCGLDDAELDDNRAFHAALLKLGVPHEYREFPGGHGWGYWRVHLRDALLALAGPLAAPRDTTREAAR